MWLGLDFSGHHRNWGPGVTNSCIWLARLDLQQSRLAIVELRPVQQLPGSDHPFIRLGVYLTCETYDSAAIDAPFSIPVPFLPNGPDCHRTLLRKVVAIECGKRLFPEAFEFVTMVANRRPPLKPPKPLRDCEKLWQAKRVNVRSTLWAGHRGGAAMTAACLKLLGNVDRPLWPWAGGKTGFLAEAFPAAQLRHWDWPYQGYAGDEGEAVRKDIVERLARIISLGAYETKLLANDNALDAVLCALAARAVSKEALGIEPPNPQTDEGWIAVHDKSILCLSQPEVCR